MNSDRAAARFAAALALAAGLAVGACAPPTSSPHPPETDSLDPQAAAPPARPAPVRTYPAGAEPRAEDCGVDPGALVDVRVVEPGIRAEVRYATADNFTGAPLPGYDRDVILLRPEAAEALARVHRRLAGQGLGLKVFDGYRPVRATQAMVMWAEYSDNAWILREGYVARRSGHNRGNTVDLTLVRLADGAELDMGTPFDTFTEAAHTANATGAVRENRATLVRAMAAEGFVNYRKEWWHFSLPGEPPPMDAPLSCFV